MVHFRNGAPDKAQYRNFKIKSFVGNDDFRAMREVVERRYRRVQDEQKRLPDLIVIDGGIGQVQAAVEAFNGLNILPPPIIGLAKKEESIVFPDARKDLQCPEATMHSDCCKDYAMRPTDAQTHSTQNLEASELESLCSMICQDLAQHADIIC